MKYTIDKEEINKEILSFLKDKIERNIKADNKTILVKAKQYFSSMFPDYEDVEVGLNAAWYMLYPYTKILTVNEVYDKIITTQIDNKNIFKYIQYVIEQINKCKDPYEDFFIKSHIDIETNINNGLLDKSYKVSLETAIKTFIFILSFEIFDNLDRENKLKI